MRRTFTILLLTLAAVLATAQNATAPYTKEPAPIIRHYTTDDGLPNDIVNCVLKTSDGFMWFGTWYGISRFDGTHFHNFPNTLSATSDQPPRKVEAMVEDSCGNIWIKTLDWRLSVFFKREERFKNVFNELKPYTRNLQIIKIQPDGNGGVLLLTKDKNLLLAKTDGKGDVKITLLADSRGKVDAVSSRLTDDLVDIRNGYASWVGKDYSLFTCRITAGAPRSETYWRGYFGQLASQYMARTDSKGNAWTLTDNELTVKTKEGTVSHITLSLKGKITEPEFFEGGMQGAFVLTPAGEALRIDPQTHAVERFSAMEQFSNSKGYTRFLGMLLDDDGILWLTTGDDGVYSILFPPSQFRLINLDPQTSGNGVRSLFQMPNGDVWVGTRSKNLYIRYADGRPKTELTYAQYHIGSVYNIMRDSRGRLWLSTKGDGLVMAIVDKNAPAGYRFRRFTHEQNNPKSLSGNNIYVTYEDSRHHIWVGTLDGGLNLISERGDSITFINKFNGMPSYPGFGLYMEVRNMAEDRNGRLWIGTIDGLMSLQTDFRRTADIRLTTYRDNGEMLANSDIYSLYRDDQGCIWVCTFGGGLSKITGEKDRKPVLDVIGVREGLKDDVILSAVGDKKGRLWLGNTHGLSCYDGRTNRVTTYGQADGLPPVDIEEAAALSNGNGEIWIGSKEGILAFNPDRLRRTRARFPVRIVSCIINNEDIRQLDCRNVTDASLPYATRMRLSHDQNMFTLEYAALNYVNQQNITFRHRLDGFDRDWHYDGGGHMASYTNVPPGDYTFVVEAIDAADPTHPNTCKLQITILPPWWATWWAYTLYILAAVVAAWFALRYIRYQIRLKNDIYVQTKIAEFQRKFTLEQEDVQFLEKVNGIIDSNLANSDFDIATISQQLGMSRSSMFKKLKAMTGEAPSEYIKNRKLAKAVDMLKNSNHSISDVAYATGFSDVGYFGKCFRKKYGMSPREYRSDNQDNKQ